MVCDRCIHVVGQELDMLDMKYAAIRLGEMELSDNPANEQLSILKDQLRSHGFEMLDDKKSTVVEKIKAATIQLILGTDEVEFDKKLSVMLEEKLQMDYHYLSSLFSSVEGITLEKYVILQRIEKAT